MKIFHFFADDFLWFLMLFLFFYYWRIHCTYSRVTSRTVKTEVVSLYSHKISSSSPLFIYLSIKFIIIFFFAVSLLLFYRNIHIYINIYPRSLFVCFFIFFPLCYFPSLRNLTWMKAAKNEKTEIGSISLIFIFILLFSSSFSLLVWINQQRGRNEKRTKQIFSSCIRSLS